MKQVLAGIILALAAGPVGAADSQRPDYFSGGDLYEICNKSWGSTACTFTVSGITQGIDIRGAIDGVKDDCLDYSKAATNDDLKNIIIGFLAANKVMHSAPAATAVVMAIGTKECKAKLQLLPPAE